MTYADTSVILARLFAEDSSPPDSFWGKDLVASRLVQYEVWNRVNARGAGASHGESARALLDRIAMVEMNPDILARALEPFPLPVRTLDSLHLATICYLRDKDPGLELATYDQALARAARTLKVRVTSP